MRAIFSFYFWDGLRVKVCHDEMMVVVEDGGVFVVYEDETFAVLRMSWLVT